MQNDLNTEEKIIESAHVVFVEKGYDGARMQEIASKAGINKALLHYYYRSKDKLFDLVLSRVLGKFLSDFDTTWDESLEFEKRIYKFVGTYIAVLVKNPFIPTFILSTASRYPDKFESIIEKIIPTAISNIKSKFGNVKRSIDNEINKGNFRDIDSTHLVINILSMTIFPIVAKPMMKTILQKDEKEFNTLLSERAEQITQFVILSLKK